MIRMGIVGYGGMGEWHHRNTAGMEHVKVLAAFDIDKERGEYAVKNAKEAFNEPVFAGYGSLEALLKDERINLVLVATPNDTHKEICLAAIRAGKNVLCEKPATMNLAELDEILEAARAEDVIFTVHQNRRWDKDYNIVKKAIEDGSVGKPFSIDTRLHGGGGIIHGWRACRENGGGMILDWGVHIIDQILDLIPDGIKHVYCQTLSVMNPGVDDFFKLVLTFEGGAIVQVEVGTFCLRSTFRTWHVCGDRGGMSVVLGYSGITGGITKVRELGNKWESKIVETYAGPTRTFAPLGEDKVIELSLPEVAPDWKDYYKNLSEALEGKTEIIVKPNQVRRVIKVMDACFKSSETGTAVAFDENN